MKIKPPEFKASYLHPKYWLTWISLLLLFIISWLPLRVQFLLGKGIGKLAYRLLKRRRHIAKRNLELCFPDMSTEEVDDMVRKNFEATGIAIFESGMGWWWPNWRVENVSHVEGLEHVEQAKNDGHGVMLLTFHFLNLEMAGRVFGQAHPAVGFYRKHNNPVIEYFQYRGRCKSNKYMIHKRDVRGMIQALKDKEAVFYLPDQDYGPKRCEFVPFFAVDEAATTTGTLLFAKESNCKAMPLITARLPGASGYLVKVLPPLENFPSGDDKADVTRVNQEVERAVKEYTDQYMWVHRRFKTRPPRDTTSLYD